MLLPHPTSSIAILSSVAHVYCNAMIYCFATLRSTLSVSALAATTLVAIMLLLVLSCQLTSKPSVQYAAELLLMWLLLLLLSSIALSLSSIAMSQICKDYMKAVSTLIGSPHRTEKEIKEKDKEKVKEKKSVYNIDTTTITAIFITTATYGSSTGIRFRRIVPIVIYLSMLLKLGTAQTGTAQAYIYIPR